MQWCGSVQEEQAQADTAEGRVPLRAAAEQVVGGLSVCVSVCVEAGSVFCSTSVSHDDVI